MASKKNKIHLTEQQIKEDAIGVVRRSLLNARQTDEAKAFDKEASGKEEKELLKVINKYATVEMLEEASKE